MLEHLLVGSGLALVLMLATAACWRAYPPAWRPPPRSALLILPLATVLTAATLAFGAAGAATAAAFALVAVVVVFLGRARKAWRVQRAIDAFEAKEDSSRTMLALRAALGPEPGSARRYVVWTRTVLHCAAQLSVKGLYREALDAAGWLDVARLEPLDACARGQLVAATSLALGDRARSRAELGRLARPAASPRHERALGALAMLLDALEGEATAVMPTFEARIAAETEPAIRTTLRAAHAHALAAEGKHDEAVVVLRQLRDGASGARAMERVVAHAGPASRLALALVSDHVPPYR